MLNTSNEYDVYSYEMGFAHASAGVPKSATCNRFYAIGYERFLAIKEV